MDVLALEALFTHTVIVSSVVFLQPLVYLTGYGSAYNTGNTNTGFVLRRHGKKLVDACSRIGLDCCFISIDLACYSLAVNSQLAGDLPKLFSFTR